MFYCSLSQELIHHQQHFRKRLSDHDDLQQYLQEFDDSLATQQQLIQEYFLGTNTPTYAMDYDDDLAQPWSRDQSFIVSPVPSTTTPASTWTSSQASASRLSPIH